MSRQAGIILNPSYLNRGRRHEGENYCQPVFYKPFDAKDPIDILHFFRILGIGLSITIWSGENFEPVRKRSVSVHLALSCAHNFVVKSVVEAYAYFLRGVLRIAVRSDHEQDAFFTLDRNRLFGYFVRDTNAVMICQ